MSEKSSFRPTLEALEDRLLLSFSFGASQPLPHQAPPPASSVQLSGSAEGGGVESMVRLRRIVYDATATHGVQPAEQISLSSAKPTFLRIDFHDVIIS
jgi:hypothetical protein